MSTYYELSMGAENVDLLRAELNLHVENVDLRARGRPSTMVPTRATCRDGLCII